MNLMEKIEQNLQKENGSNRSIYIYQEIQDPKYSNLPSLTTTCRAEG